MKKLTYFFLTLFMLIGGGNLAFAITIEKTIGEIATANGWANSDKITSIELDDVITATVSTGSNTGKYYSSGPDWRIYHSENGSLTITAKTGYKINSIIITYTIDKKGVLLDSDKETTIESGAVVTVSNENPNSKIFYAGGGESNKTNGVVRVTGFTISYEEAGDIIPTPSVKYSATSYELFFDSTPEYPTLTATTADGIAIANEDIIFESSNSSVATINGEGEITLVGKGNTEISATYIDESDNDKEYTAKYTLTVKYHKATKFGWYDSEGTLVTSMNVEVGTTDYVLPVFNANKFTTICESSDEAIATVTDNGEITLNTSKVGTVTITAAGERTAYDDEEASLTINVTKKNPTIAFANETVNLQLGKNNTYTQLPSSNSDGEITFDSSNKTVATVDNNGLVTVLAAGTTIITANQAEADNWNSASATYTINVTDPNNNYVLVTDDENLNDGDYIVFVGQYKTSKTEYWRVMGDYNSSKTRMNALEIDDITNNQTSVPSATSIFTLGKEDANETTTWTFYSSAGYLSTLGNSNGIALNNEVTDKSHAKIEIGDTDEASVVFTTGSKSTLSPNLSNDVFGCFGSVQSSNHLYIYRKAEKKTISTFQYASYVPSMNVIIPENVKAFYLKNEDITGESATLTKVEAGTVVEAGTALVVYTSNAEGETVYFPANANETTTLTDNVLKVASENNKPIANQDYVFGQIDGNVGFYQFEEGFSVADGTVFVRGGSSNGLNAKGFRITFDNETTGISNATVKNEASSVIYNLAGQKVDADYKGIVIKNGKKYINK